MGNTDTYRQFCNRLGDVPLFLQPEWWDAAAGPGQWDAAVAEKGGQAVAAMPYVAHRKLGLTTLAQPPLTPYTGWLVAYPDGQKAHSRQSFSHEVVGALVQQLPRYARLHFRLYPQHHNLLPWIWAGARAQVRFTYRLDIRPDESLLMDGLRENLRRALRSTEGWNTSQADAGTATLLQGMKEESYRSKGQHAPIGNVALQRIVQYLVDSGRGALLTTSPPQGEPAAAAVLAIDGDICMYLAGASAPSERKSGASTRLLWEAVRYAKGRGCTTFDFEGSMVPSIERYFRAFNGELTSFNELVHHRHFLVKLREMWR